eukprot:5491590-Amphidinium_carterae.1
MSKANFSPLFSSLFSCSPARSPREMSQMCAFKPPFCWNLGVWGSRGGLRSASASRAVFVKSGGD